MRRIADAGFSHVHWCHQWCTDFLYAECEVKQIAAWLRDFGLALLDLHGSSGKEKCWADSEEYRRRAGVELVRNRLEMTARLGGEVVIMHTVPELNSDGSIPEPLKKSLDELEPHARKLGVRIAVENGRWPVLRAILNAYAPDYAGLCYDSGHGHNDGAGLDNLEELKHRLISVHLHDNDGKSDQHRLPFSGTIDWERLAGILATSAYTKCISMESNMGQEGISGEDEFLAKAFAAGERLSAMVAGMRMRS